MSSPKFGTLNPPGSQVITPEAVVSAAADAIRAQVAADADRAAAAAAGMETARTEIPVLSEATQLGTILLPGDQAVHARSSNGPTLVTLSTGQTRGNFTVEDLRDAFSKSSGLPGDNIEALVVDQNGITLLGWDTRSGRLYDATAQGGATPGPNPNPGSVTSILTPDAVSGPLDAWHVFEGGNGQIYYQSNQWVEPIGYEMRDGRSLAQTRSIATGVIAFGGGGLGVVRPRAERYPFHVVSPLLEAPDMMGAEASAAATLDLQTAARATRPTTVAITAATGSMLEADALAGSALRSQLAGSLVGAVQSLSAWGKTLFVDRIILSLLDGATGIGELTADAHYAAIGNGLRMEVVDATGQGDFPILVVRPSAGTRTDGMSEVALAEGRLHLTHFSLGFLVATPMYPFPLQGGMPGTHTPEALALADEITAVAINEVHAGRQWYLPTLEEATFTSARVIRARFNAMSDLVIRDPAEHGFSISGATNGATITGVSVSGLYATITLSATPTGTISLMQAWGRTGDRGDGRTANRSSLTDGYSYASRLVEGHTHHRYAAPGRVTVR